MTLQPITLGVSVRVDAKGAVLSGRLPSKAETESALHRDGFTCRCCGFSSKRFQRVVSDPLSVQAGAFITVCTFCELTLALERAGQVSGATLVWLPELTQAELNNVLHALYVAKFAPSALTPVASRALEVLGARRAEAKKRLGTDDPLVLSTALIEAVDEATYQTRMAKLEGIRLLAGEHYLVRQRGADADVFPQMLSYWSSPEGLYGRKPVAEWPELFEKLASKLEEKAPD